MFGKMYIEELKERDLENEEGQQLCGKEDDSEIGEGQGGFLIWDAKRVIVGAGARAFFYPTLLYNVVRNKIQSEFRWWDRVDEVCIIIDKFFTFPLVCNSCLFGYNVLIELYDYVDNIWSSIQ